jgi:hypothetical protein
MNDVMLPPTPSQMDDWALYIRIIGEHIRFRQGSVAYSDWREFLDTQIIAKDKFIERRDLEASFPRYKLVERKKIAFQG